jgi:Fic family protein
MSSDTSPPDRGEQTFLIEPMLLGSSSPARGVLTDLALELAQKSAGFRRSLPLPILHSLASLVRSMNCYYSNLIEGHDTHPVDIERALRNDYSHDIGKRNLQLEAIAHMAVQQWIDDGGLGANALTAGGIREIHRRFCALLPAELQSIEDPDSGQRIPIIPGAVRTRDVPVGSHIPISPGALPRFMERFESVYAAIGKTESILASAAAHHRLLWMHPFLDGNGRVARLMSHAHLLQLLDSAAL